MAQDDDPYRRFQSPCHTIATWRLKSPVGTRTGSIALRISSDISKNVRRVQARTATCLQMICVSCLSKSKIMAQDYDKIFRENIEQVIITLAQKLLGIDPATLEEIPDDSQYTIERKPDLLKKVKPGGGKKDYILQMEFQSTDSHKMLKRLLFYYGLLFADYGLEVLQYVFYIGKKNKPTMPTNIQHTNLQFKYELINIMDIDYELFIHSDRPEDVVVAILCDFKKKSPEYIIDTLSLIHI